MKWLSVLGFILVFVAEFLLFDRMTSLHQARVYPQWNDQIQPLVESYTGYEYRQTHGFWPGLGHTLVKPAAQGTLHSFWALLVFEAAGRPSRSAALAVNLLAFLVWQAALALAVIRGTGSRALGWVSVGLTLALAWPWSGVQGSATDVRLDQVSMCMMGLSLATALLADGFRSRCWSISFGLAVALTLLTHFVTGAYFVVIFAACLAWIWFSRERPRRALNLGLAAAVAAIIAAPFFWLNRREIYEHHWVGHYLHPDGLLGSSRLPFSRAFLQLWRHLVVDQLGGAFWAASGAAILVLTGAVWFARRQPAAASAAGRQPWPRETAELSLIFLLGPLLVLAGQNNDRMVVAGLGVAAPGAVTLLLALCAGLRARAGGRISAGALGRLSASAAAAAMLIGAGYFVARQIKAPYDANFAADVGQIHSAADQVYAAVRRGGLANPRVAVDQVTDCFDGTILSVICYERHQAWVPFIMELPTGISAAPEPVLMEHLAASDFVFLTEDGPAGQWPYDRQMFALRPKITAWCEAYLQLTGRFTIFGRHIALYQRPGIGATPAFLSPRRLLASTKGDFNQRLAIARGSARYTATGLPAGLALDENTGWIRGRPSKVGTFVAQITASNAAGTTTNRFTFQVEDASFHALVNAPDTCLAGRPTELRFEAFDANGKLNFIEISDLTTRKILDRLPAGLDERQNWQGGYTATLGEPGRHSMLMRFVRLEAGQYTFLDKFFEIHVAPAPPARD